MGGGRRANKEYTRNAVEAARVTVLQGQTTLPPPVLQIPDIPCVFPRMKNVRDALHHGASKCLPEVHVRVHGEDGIASGIELVGDLARRRVGHVGRRIEVRPTYDGLCMSYGGSCSSLWHCD